MALVVRKYRCDFGHEWKDVVPKGYAVPSECPMCQAIVAESVRPAHYPADARSETQSAPAIRGERMKAIERFEYNAFKRPHFDDGSPMLTNLRDNTRPGEIAAIAETPSSNEAMRLMHEQHESQQNPNAPKSDLVLAANMAGVGGGWGGVNPQVLQASQAAGPGISRPVVDLQSRRQLPK